MTSRETQVMTGNIPSAIPKIPLKKRGEVLITTPDGLVAYAKSKGYHQLHKGGLYYKLISPSKGWKVLSQSSLAQLFLQDTAAQKVLREAKHKNTHTT